MNHILLLTRLNPGTRKSDGASDDYSRMGWKDTGI